MQAGAKVCVLHSAAVEGVLLIALGTVSGLGVTSRIQGLVGVEKGEDGMGGEKCLRLGSVAHRHVERKEHDLRGGKESGGLLSKHAISQCYYSACI